jgi:23S rRNA (uracil1939-C5)-methyltransferase
MVRVELEVTRMVHGGRALGSAPDGRVLLVRGAIPGERVVAEGTQVKGVWLGETVEIRDPSPDRLPAPEHPGLDLGHVRYERQLALKREVVLDAYRRATGGMQAPPLPPLVPSPATWGYRNAVQPALIARSEPPAAASTAAGSAEAASTAAGSAASVGSLLGYRRPGSHEVIALSEDPTANPACRAAWRAVAAARLPGGVREVAIRGNDDGLALVALIATTPARQLLDAAHALVGEGIAGVSLAPFDPRGRFRGGAERLAGARSLRQRYGEVVLTITATAFAQPNPAAAGDLYRRAADSSPVARHALDLFAGNGALAMHVAARAAKVTAVEIDRGSVERGRRDAGAAGLGNLVFVRADARSLRVPDDVDLISVDPPRAGLASALRAAIDASRAGTLLYVACDVATWARDAADLLRRGWTLSALEAFDFQPHTHHIELLSCFQRGAAAPA